MDDPRATVGAGGTNLDPNANHDPAAGSGTAQPDPDQTRVVATPKKKGKVKKFLKIVAYIVLAAVSLYLFLSVIKSCAHEYEKNLQDVAAIKGDLKIININASNNTQKLNAAEGEITKMNGALSTLTDGLKTTTDLSNVNSRRIDELQGAHDKLASKVSSKKKPYGLEQKLGTLTKSVDEAKDRLAKLEKAAEKPKEMPAKVVPVEPPKPAPAPAPAPAVPAPALEKGPAPAPEKAPAPAPATLKPATTADYKDCWTAGKMGSKSPMRCDGKGACINRPNLCFTRVEADAYACSNGTPYVLKMYGEGIFDSEWTKASCSNG